MTDARQEALAQIVGIARAHHLTPQDIATALTADPEAVPRNRVMLFFSALGGIFIFAGIITFIGMFWDEMNSAARVIVTLGSGFALFVMGVMAAQSEDVRHHKACTPLLAMAGWLQPTGLFVMLNEYFHHNNDIRYACLFVFGVMLVQQLATFVAIRRSVLFFFALFFGGSFFAALFNIEGVPDEWAAVIIGVSLLNLAAALDRAGYRGLAATGFFVGGGIFFGGAFDVLEHTSVELIYLGLACFMVYVSTVVRSTALMVVSVIAMLGYIGYFTEEYFVHSIGWPAALIVLGFIFVGIGIGAVNIRKKYI